MMDGLTSYCQFVDMTWTEEAERAFQELLDRLAPTQLMPNIDIMTRIFSAQNGSRAEEQSEFSDLEDIYKPREPLEIQEGDLELASNFLNSLGEDLMEDDVLDFL